MYYEKSYISLKAIEYVQTKREFNKKKRIFVVIFTEYVCLCIVFILNLVQQFF